MFVSVVSRDSIRIAFLVAALNDLEVLGTSVSSTAYINDVDTIVDHVYAIVAGTGEEFSPKKEGWPVIITRAFCYRLCGSGKAWREHMTSSLQELG